MGLGRRLAAIAAKLRADDLLVRLAKGGAAALAIKIAAAGLSFGMLVMLARVMSLEDFGRFGFAYSLAMLCSNIGSLGQRMLVLRFAPAYLADGEDRLLRGVVRHGYALVFAGCTALGLAMLGAALLWPAVGSPGLLGMAGALTLAVGIADYQAHVLRALGGVTMALVPRDVVWRVLVIAGCAAVAAADWPDLTAPEALALAAGTLVAAIAVQAALHADTRPSLRTRPSARYEWSAWRKISLSLWGGAVAQSAGPNLMMVLAGVLLAPAETALVFAALRLGILLELVPIAANMVVAAQLSRAWHKREMGAIQRMCTMVSAGASAAALAAFAFLALFGGWLLTFFGAGFDAAHGLLMIFAAAYVVKSFVGPAAMMLQLSGQERSFLWIVAGANLGAVALLVALAPSLGGLGAALATSLGLVAWTVASAFRVQRAIGVDTTAFAVLRRRPR